MLVSHSHAFIYLKTRKTAGTLVEMALQPWCMPSLDDPVEERTHAIVSGRGVVGQRMTPWEELRREDRIWFNHIPAVQLRNLLGDRIWRRYRKIIVIRNPFDRMVSRFHWSTGFAAAYIESAGQAEPVADDRDFADVKQEFRDFVLGNRWTDDIEIAHVDGAFCADLVIRYENLAADLGAVASELELEPARLRLPVTKDGSRHRRGRAVAEYFDRETIDRVMSRMAWVFDIFGYDTLPSTQQLPRSSAT